MDIIIKEKKIIINNLRIDDISIEKLLEHIKLTLDNNSQLTITNLNPDKCNNVWSGKYQSNLINDFDIVTPDSVGMSLGINILFNKKIKERISGDSIAPLIYNFSKHRDVRLFFLGGKPNVALKASKLLRKAYPWINIVGTHYGYDTIKNNRNLIRYINDINPNILFIGFGAPKENKWILDNKEKLKANIFITMGGYFDHVLRRIDCYPPFVNKWKINWLYRLYLEPRRLSKRYLLGNPRFLKEIFKIKFNAWHH